MQFQTNTIHLWIDNRHKDKWAHTRCYFHLLSNSLPASFIPRFLPSFSSFFPRVKSTIHSRLGQKQKEEFCSDSSFSWCRLALVDITSGSSAALQRPAVQRPSVAGAGHCSPTARRQALVVDTIRGVFPPEGWRAFTESNNWMLVLEWAIKDFIN